MSEDLINPQPAIFMRVGKSAGGVTSGESQPRQVTAAPMPSKTGGYYGKLKTDKASAAAGGSATEVTNPLSERGVSSPEVVGWGAVDEEEDDDGKRY